MGLGLKKRALEIKTFKIDIKQFQNAGTLEKSRGRGVTHQEVTLHLYLLWHFLIHL